MPGEMLLDADGVLMNPFRLGILELLVRRDLPLVQIGIKRLRAVCLIDIRRRPIPGRRQIDQSSAHENPFQIDLTNTELEG